MASTPPASAKSLALDGCGSSAAGDVDDPAEARASAAAKTRSMPMRARTPAGEVGEDLVGAEEERQRVGRGDRGGGPDPGVGREPAAEPPGERHHEAHDQHQQELRGGHAADRPRRHEQERQPDVVHVVEPVGALHGMGVLGNRGRPGRGEPTRVDDLLGEVALVGRGLLEGAVDEYPVGHHEVVRLVANHSIQPLGLPGDERASGDGDESQPQEPGHPTSSIGQAADPGIDAVALAGWLLAGGLVPVGAGIAGRCAGVAFLDVGVRDRDLLGDQRVARGRIRPALGVGARVDVHNGRRLSTALGSDRTTSMIARQNAGV